MIICRYSKLHDVGREVIPNSCICARALNWANITPRCLTKGSRGHEGYGMRSNREFRPRALSRSERNTPSRGFCTIPLYSYSETSGRILESRHAESSLCECSCINFSLEHLLLNSCLFPVLFSFLSHRRRCRGDLSREHVRFFGTMTRISRIRKIFNAVSSGATVDDGDGSSTIIRHAIGKSGTNLRQAYLSR